MLFGTGEVIPLLSRNLKSNGQRIVFKIKCDDEEESGEQEESEDEDLDDNYVKMLCYELFSEMREI